MTDTERLRAALEWGATYCQKERTEEWRTIRDFIERGLPFLEAAYKYTATMRADMRNARKEAPESVDAILAEMKGGGWTAGWALRDSWASRLQSAIVLERKALLEEVERLNWLVEGYKEWIGEGIQAARIREIAGGKP